MPVFFRAGAAAFLAAGLLVAAPTAEGQPTSADLVATGAVAGGETTVPSYHLVAFTFAVTDKGPGSITSSADLDYTSVRHGTVVDQLCIPRDGHAIEPDSPYCESGGLRPGQSNRMTLIVQPDSVSGVALRVRVCASNESGVPDPRPGNNCVVKSVLLQ
jgi:hypothetical protein